MVNKKLFLILFFTILNTLFCYSQEVFLEESWFSESLSNKGVRILETPDWKVWGCSPIYDEQGKVHVFFSRWKNPPEGNWLINSEVAHAVADKPEGPYKVLGTVLKGRGGDFWDANTIHNPSVYKVNDKYIMFYIGTNITNAEPWRDGAPEANTQKIGIAVADSLNGVWKRFDKPILDVSPNIEDWDSYCVVNPGFVKHPDGTYYLFYRAWDRNNDDLRKIGVAISQDLLGPYTKFSANPIIHYAPAQCEDPVFFFYKNKFHCIMRDMGFQNYHSGLYISSDDGLLWEPPKQAYKTYDNYFDKINSINRFERPQILLKNGKPEYLFCVLEGGEFGSSGAVIKINND